MNLLSSPASSSFLSLSATDALRNTRTCLNPRFNPSLITTRKHSIEGKESAKVKVVNDVTGVSLHPVEAEITWQIIVGALAGVIPFIVAGIEFSKRIVAQRRCEVCEGSGIVFRDKKYYRCPDCGGFLPWQSWKRFFSG